MKTIQRDILFTLTLKFFLLTLLWWVCFKHHGQFESAQSHYLGIPTDLSTLKR